MAILPQFREVSGRKIAMGSQSLSYGESVRFCSRAAAGMPYNGRMRRGIIFLNGYKLFPGLDRCAQRLEEEFAARGVRLTRAYSTSFPGFIDDNGRLPSNFLEADFIIYLDKDKYIAALLEKMGFRLFNNAKAIEICDDKMLTHLHLSNHGIKMPKTLSGPLNYSGKIDASYLDVVRKELPFPIVVKHNFGSLGAGVYLANDEAGLAELEAKLGADPRLYQRFIASSRGKDIRLILVGGKVIAAMERQARNGEFRSNIGLGGKGKALTPPSPYIEVAEKAAKLLQLDYCGIDLLIGPKGEPILCEVNSNAFFEGIEQATGVDVAKAYAEYIISEVYPYENR